MRDTTKIKALAEESLVDLETLAQRQQIDGQVIGSVTENLKEIANIAKKMDARTGRLDPSARKTE